MPTVFDVAFVVLATVVVTALETLIFFPRFKADAAASVPGTRLRAYRRIVAMQWLAVAVIVALWIGFDRAWADLGLVPSRGLQLWSGVVIAALITVLAARQTRAVARIKPEGRAQLRSAFASVEFFMPHTRDESRWFMLLSLTAGICEELVYRGFLVWVLRAHVGLGGALAIGVVVFALGHAYQGRRGILKTGAAGAVLSLIVVATGWLIPAMVVHAIIDLNAGMLGYAVLGEPKEAPSS